MNVSSKLLDSREVAKLMNMSQRWVKDAVKAGKIDGDRISNRIKIPESAVVEYLQNAKICP